MHCGWKHDDTHTHTHMYFLIKIEPSCVHAYVLCTIRYGVTGESVWWVERVCCCAVQTHHFGQVLLNAARSYGGHGKKACACWGLDCFPSLTQPKTKPQIIIMTGQFHSQLEMWASKLRYWWNNIEDNMSVNPYFTNQRGGKNGFRGYKLWFDASLALRCKFISLLCIDRSWPQACGALLSWHLKKEVLVHIVLVLTSKAFWGQDDAGQNKIYFF